MHPPNDRLLSDDALAELERTVDEKLQSVTPLGDTRQAAAQAKRERRRLRNQRLLKRQ